MAEMKKYLDQVALGALVDQIKAEDTKVLEAAKKYTDDAGKLYDVAGAASTAEANAKEYTDALAEGQVATNKSDIETLKGDANTEGSVAKAVADAKSAIDADVDAVEAIATQNQTDIAAIKDAENGILAQAKAHAEAEDAKVQGEVDALELYVGTIPAGATATNVVAYVQEKTAGIATEGAMTELGNRVGVVEGKVATIEGDYLKAADKTELEGKITGVQTAVDGEKTRAEGIEAGLRTDINTVMGDYLKAADKTELQGNIDTVAGAVERLTNGVSAEEIDGVNDLIQYVKDHGTEVTGMQEDIAGNTEAIDGVAERMGVAEGKITALESASATHALKTEVEAVSAAMTEYRDAHAGDYTNAQIDAAIKVVADDVAAMVEAYATDEELAAAIEAAKTDASNKDAVVLAEAQKATEAVQTALDTHTANGDIHVTAEQKTAWTTAAGKAHEHGNQSVLDGITSAKVIAWDAAEGNAKTFAQGLNDTMQTAVDGIDARVTKNAEDIALKAAQADLEDAIDRIAANEEAIAANASAINSFAVITPEEVAALFA